MTSLRTKMAAWFVWFSSWGFGFSVLLGIASVFLPSLRFVNWLHASVLFALGIIAGLWLHMGAILPDAVKAGTDVLRIAKKALRA